LTFVAQLNENRETVADEKVWREKMGEAIRDARKRVRPRITQHQLADRAGVSLTTMGDYERGKTTPKGYELAVICRTVGPLIFSVDGQKLVIACDESVLTPRSVGKQFHLELGLSCESEDGLLRKVKTSRVKNKLIVDAVLSA
jgi:DNA-binding XRE family transcriptional regulator